MRELTIQDMEQASGGIIPAIVGLAIAIGSTAVRSATAQAFMGGVGIGWALEEAMDHLSTNSQSCLAP